MRLCDSTKAWKDYYDEKKKGFPYSATAAFKLQGYSYKMMDHPTIMFLPYWTALELIKEGQPLQKPLSDILAKCKNSYQKEKERQESFKCRPDTFNGYELKWEPYRLYDESYNSYDGYTEICRLPFRATEEEKKELEEDIWIHFRDPYGDGRDCTGAPFTNYIQIMTTSKPETIIVHSVGYDV